MLVAITGISFSLFINKKVNDTTYNEEYWVQEYKDKANTEVNISYASMSDEMSAKLRNECVKYLDKKAKKDKEEGIVKVTSEEDKTKYYLSDGAIYFTNSMLFRFIDTDNTTDSLYIEMNDGKVSFNEPTNKVSGESINTSTTVSTEEYLVNINNSVTELINSTSDVEKNEANKLAVNYITYEGRDSIVELKEDIGQVESIEYVLLGQTDTHKKPDRVYMSLTGDIGSHKIILNLNNKSKIYAYNIIG